MPPHRGKFVAHYRVSTDKQGRSGLGLEAQVKAVRDYLDGGAWELIAEYREVESGKHNDRPELAKALALCKRERATLLIARLDRLARNVHFISGLMETKVKFVACDMPEATPFMLHIYAAVAQEEARAISTRTKLALQAAKTRGVALGAPRHKLKLAHAKAVMATKAGADQRAANVVPVIQAVQRSGATTLRAIAEALNARGVRPARGGQWYASTVRDVLQRAGAYGAKPPHRFTH
jgi:DNA invertase Pin-like site-specific DNA recombinase